MIQFVWEAVAYFPLIVLMAGSITTLFIKFVTKKIGGQVIFFCFFFLIFLFAIFSQLLAICLISI